MKQWLRRRGESIPRARKRDAAQAVNSDMSTGRVPNNMMHKNLERNDGAAFGGGRWTDMKGSENVAAKTDLRKLRSASSSGVGQSDDLLVRVHVLQ